MLPFCQHCDRRLTFEKLAYIYWKAANFTVLNFFLILVTAKSNVHTTPWQFQKHQMFQHRLNWLQTLNKDSTCQLLFGRTFFFNCNWRSNAFCWAIIFVSYSRVWIIGLLDNRRSDTRSSTVASFFEFFHGCLITLAFISFTCRHPICPKCIFVIAIQPALLKC